MVKMAFPAKGETELLMRLNMALNEFADITELCRTEGTLTKAGVMWVNLPTGFSAIHSAWLQLTATGEQSSVIVDYEINAAGTQIRLMDKYDRVWLVPQAAANYDIKIEYVSRPTAMTLTAGTAVGQYDGEVDTKIPSQFHDALCYRAMEPLFFVSGDINNARFCRERWEQARKEGKIMARRRFTKAPHSPDPHFTEM